MSTQTAVPENPAAAPQQGAFELYDAAQVAACLNVPKSWVLEQTRSRAEDPAPHLKLGKYVRFRLDSDFFKWLERRRKGATHADNL